MHFPTVVSFYTQNTPYEIEAKKLIASCEKFEVPHCIEGVDSLGSWELNCSYKPFFILRKLEELKQPVLWVDVDAQFARKPVWEEVFKADIGAYIDPYLEPEAPSKVRSSVFFANTTEGAREVMRLWIAESKRQLLDRDRTAEFWDQEALRDALLLYVSSQVKIAPLPLTYTYIFDHPHDRKKELNPLLIHYQASRGLKKIVNKASFAISLNSVDPPKFC